MFSPSHAPTKRLESSEPISLGIDGLSNYVEIGRGGFATVYSADDEALGRKVAVKVLRHLDDDGIRRFQREARILADLGSHENLAAIYRFDRTTNGNPCFVMEHVPGGSLADVLSRVGTIEAKTAVSYAIQVARALVHTHARGIVHRDIKPSNVLLANDGRVKLSDFGIAVIRSASATLNAATFEHAAPEVFLDGSTKNDERSDLYSLASTLYNLIDGSAPYSIAGERSHEALLHRVLNSPIPTTDLAPDMNRFWDRALAKKPSDRFQTASEMLAVLTALSREAPPSPRPLAPPTAHSTATSTATPSRTQPPAPGPTPPPVSGAHAGDTIGVGTAADGQPLSPQEIAVVDSFAGSQSTSQRHDVASLTTTQSVLFTLAQDVDLRVAGTAVARLTDQALLGRLVEPERPKQTRVLAAGRVADGPLAARLADDPDNDVRAALAGSVADPVVIQKLITDRAEQVRAAVITQIRNPKVLRLVAQSPDPETRRAIAGHADSEPLLMTLARDADPSVRTAALSRLDVSQVAQLAEDADPGISRSALNHIDDPHVLYKLTSHRFNHVQQQSVSRISDEPTLARIAGNSQHPQWQAALAQISDDVTLAQLARNSDDQIAASALSRIRSDSILQSLAARPDYRFRLEATDRITNRDALQSLVDSREDPAVATRARDILSVVNERDERLSTVRIFASAIVITALAAVLVSSTVWPYSVAVVICVALGYRVYISQDG